MSIPRIAVTTNPDVSVSLGVPSRACLPPIRSERTVSARAARAGSFSLAGKVRSSPAAVGIGRAIALAFGRFGADSHLRSRRAALEDVAIELRSFGCRVVTGLLDVRDSALVDAFVAQIGVQLDRVDVVVNNAGGGFSAAFLDVSDRGQDASCVRTSRA